MVNKITPKCLLLPSFCPVSEHWVIVPWVCDTLVLNYSWNFMIETLMSEFYYIPSCNTYILYFYICGFFLILVLKVLLLSWREAEQVKKLIKFMNLGKSATSHIAQTGIPLLSPPLSPPPTMIIRSVGKLVLQYKAERGNKNLNSCYQSVAFVNYLRKFWKNVLIIGTEVCYNIILSSFLVYRLIIV